MSNKKLGQEPAFPLDGEHAYSAIKSNQAGVSKRLYIATAAMQGLLVSDWDTSKELLVKSAYNVADEMLKQELEEIDE